MQSLSTPSIRPEFGPLLTVTPLELDVIPVAEAVPVLEAIPVLEFVPVLEIKRPPVEAPVQTPVDDGFLQVLQANLQAAARHVAMGHEAKSFRECSRPACRDAAKVVPQVEHVEVDATDAELEVVFKRVMAALETNPVKPAAARTSLRAAL